MPFQWVWAASLSLLPCMHIHPCCRWAGPRGWGGHCSSYLDVVLPAVGFLEVLCSISQSLRNRAQGGQRLRKVCAQPKAFSIPSSPWGQAGSGTPWISCQTPRDSLAPDILQLAVWALPPSTSGSHRKGEACKDLSGISTGLPGLQLSHISCPQEGRGTPEAY